MTDGVKSGIRSGITWARLATGPLARAVSTQLNYALADWSCQHQTRVVPVLALALALIALLGGALSARAWRAVDQDTLETGGMPRHFLAGMSLLFAVLFAVAA